MNTPAEPPESISPLERYHLFRSRIEHEDNLVIQRLSWLMASQSFLFTAYAIVTNGLTNAALVNGDMFVRRLFALERVIPIVAILNSLLIFISIIAALKAIGELRNRYFDYPEILKTLSLQTSGIPRRMGQSAPVLLPLLFFAVWLFLLLQ